MPLPAKAEIMNAATQRIDWVDYAKGICIILVVMMHSTLGAEAAFDKTGFMHQVVAFAKPFRMPDFFLISGLFLARVIDRDWRTYLDRKLVHFAYFYVIWVTIQFLFKAPGMAAQTGWESAGAAYLLAFIEPFGTLWFIYLLPIFFIVTKATRAVPWPVIWIIGALLESSRIHTGWTVIDEFASRFVYFYSGYIFANFVFTFAARVQNHPVSALFGLGAWAIANSLLVAYGISETIGISLILGYAGALAIVATGALLARMHWLDALRFCGEHSLVIYLAFFLPMAITRTVFLKFGNALDVGTIALIVTVAGVTGALAMWFVTRKAGAHFLFKRPDAFYIAPRAKPRLQAAE